MIVIPTSDHLSFLNAPVIPAQAGIQSKKGFFLLLFGFSVSGFAAATSYFCVSQK
jgi:hypothetical protein